MVCTALLLVGGPGERAAGSDGAAGGLRGRIRELQQELRTTADPDSITFLLARTYRESATIPDRRRALDLLDGLRPVYRDRPAFHRERARLYEDCGRTMDARSALDEVLRLLPEDVDARIQMARLLLTELLHTFDPATAREIQDWLAQALERDPDHREALFLMALTSHLAWTLSPGDPLPRTYEGKQCALRILDRDPGDTDARLMLAIHQMDLGEVEDADRTFKRSINEAPARMQEAFLSCTLTGTPGLAKYLGNLGPDEQGLMRLAYWRRQDPTPLTVANENQMEFWKRLALAQFLFGEPGGRLGWETDPGRVLVRYGEPRAQAYDPGNVTGDGYGMQRFQSTIEFQPPSLSWAYRFRDVTFTVRFEDRNLQGIYTADEASTRALVALERAVPVVFHVASPGSIRNLYLTSAGTPGPDGTVQQSVTLGLPPWRETAAADWSRNSRIEILVRDSTFTKVRSSVDRIRPEHHVHPFPDTDLLLFSQRYDLKPGRYSITAFIEDRDSGMHGAFTRPLIVRDYAAHPGLEISDLELALALVPRIEGPKLERLGREYLPNPMGLVGDDRNLDVLYELYHLTEREGLVSYLARYTILPRAYVLGFDRHVEHGRASSRSLLRMANAGLAIGEIALTSRTYSDIRFPRETTAVRGERLPKGARVDVSGLDPGEYVLVVTVVDAISGEEANAQVPFQILADEALRDLLSFRSPD